MAIHVLCVNKSLHLIYSSYKAIVSLQKFWAKLFEALKWFLRVWRDRKALGFQQKDLYLGSEDEQKSYVFETT